MLAESVRFSTTQHTGQFRGDTRTHRQTVATGACRASAGDARDVLRLLPERVGTSRQPATCRHVREGRGGTVVASHVRTAPWPTCTRLCVGEHVVFGFTPPKQTVAAGGNEAGGLLPN